jgi:hypothetical protein
MTGDPVDKATAPPTPAANEILRPDGLGMVTA